MDEGVYDFLSLVLVIIVWFWLDIYKIHQYRFCRQQKGKSCRNWMCKKTDECNYYLIFKGVRFSDEKQDDQ